MAPTKITPMRSLVPRAKLTLTIANPALLGVIEPGQKFYLDFTPAEV
jgi:hypothetical protein